LHAIADWMTESNQEFANLGIAVSTAGDGEGDTYSDVIVGAPAYNNGQDDEGQVFLYRGGAGGLETTASWTAEGDQLGAGFGSAVATAGDVNGDGFSDVIVGAPFYDNPHINEGGAFVFTGSPAGLNEAPDLRFYGAQSGAAYGTSVATAGDVNGDGFSDFIVGAPLHDNGQVDEGRITEYLSADGGLRSISTIEIDQPGARFGASVGTAGDVSGDGFSDIIAGAAFYANGQVAEGGAFVYQGNGVLGLDRLPRQRRVDDSAPIAVLGRSDSPTQFRLRALGRSPVGRSFVRLQVEVKPAGVPFDGTGLVTGPSINTGQPGVAGSVASLAMTVTGLVPDQLYHWRLRILGRSPFAPRTPWLWQPMNGLEEGDLRTDRDLATVAGGSPASAIGRWLGPGAPNPFAESTEVSYTLPGRGRLRLAVYDVQGRYVAALADGIQSAGEHTARWAGRDERGARRPAGVYLVRLEFGGRVETQKIVYRP
jgi:hypothetical protein